MSLTVAAARQTPQPEAVSLSPTHDHLLGGEERLQGEGEDRHGGQTLGHLEGLQVSGTVGEGVAWVHASVQYLHHNIIILLI